MLDFKPLSQYPFDLFSIHPMTCVLSPWQPFSLSHGWSSPMDPALPPSLPSDFAKRSYHHSNTSESESTPASNSSGKKRTSRAGTRSVSTLSAAQLERKRANDRDAQRAIRQRTKDHIDGLEKTISDLRAMQEATDKLLAAAQQQNREFKEENTFLWSKLKEAGISINMNVPGSMNVSPKTIPLERPQLVSESNRMARQISDLSIQTSDSTPHSAISLANSQSSESQFNSWQQQPQSSVMQNPASNLGTATIPNDPSLTNWRPHNNTQIVETSTVTVPHQDLPPKQPHTVYEPLIEHTPGAWTMPSQPHVYPDQQLPQQYASTPQQQDFPPQSSVRTYTPHTTPQQSTYQTPVPPQVEFQGMTVASPVSYQMPQQQHATFGQQSPYPLSPTNPGPPELSGHSTPMPPPRAVGMGYDPGFVGQGYGQQMQQQPEGDFRDASGGHPNYPGSQYQSR